MNSHLISQVHRTWRGSYESDYISYESDHISYDSDYISYESNCFSIKKFRVYNLTHDLHFSTTWNFRAHSPLKIGGFDPIGLSSDL